MSIDKQTAATGPTVKRTPWTTWDIVRLKTMANTHAPIASIAQHLERTEAAVRSKAVLLGLSLAATNTGTARHGQIRGRMQR